MTTDDLRQDDDIEFEFSELKKVRARKLIWRKTNGLCWYCGEHMDPWTFSIDHFLPRSGGGKHVLSNLVPCCRVCNGRKRNKTLEQFREIMTRKSGTAFTDVQIAYLHSVNITLPETKQHVFYFEQENMA